MSDEVYMRRCFALAQLGLGNVSPNPIVGSVIVHNNTIIGEGYHQKYGQAHAEVNAVKSVPPHQKHLLNSATIYVSLEPCAHYGKTPPCVDLILKHQFKRVVIACSDPNPEVSGKSIRKLKANGIEVTFGVLEQEAKHLIRRFITFHQKHRPYIILKYAQSADQQIGKSTEQVWISNPLTKRLVHKWRSEEGAILIGTNTAKIDNPRLNTRLYFGNHPVKVLIDRDLSVDTRRELFKDGKILVFNTTKTAEIGNVQYIKTNFDNRLLEHICNELYQLDINSLIVEGGKYTLQQYISAEYWDEARILNGSLIIGEGISAPRIDQKQLKFSKAIADNTLDIYYA